LVAGGSNRVEAKQVFRYQRILTRAIKICIEIRIEKKTIKES